MRPTQSGSAAEPATSSGKAVEKTKLTRSGSGYENVPPGKSDGERPEAFVTYSPMYVNLGPSTGDSGSTPKAQKTHASDLSLSAEHSSLPILHTSTTESDAAQLKRRSGTEIPSNLATLARLGLLAPSVETAKGCSQCEELSHLVSLWQLGASGLARNYSRILAQLTSARDATMRLESKIRERELVEAIRRQTSSPLPTNLATELSASSDSPKLKRHSAYTTGTDPTTSLPTGGTPQHDSNIANQMYPETVDQSKLRSPYEKELTDLNGYLGKAIDLCQQLAAACFKSTQPSPKGKQSATGSTISALNSKSNQKKKLERVSSQPQKPVASSAPHPSFRPALGSISEENPSGTLKRRYGENDDTPAGASHGVSNGLCSGSDTESEEEEEKEGTHEVVQSSSTKRRTVHSYSPTSPSKKPKDGSRSPSSPSSIPPSPSPTDPSSAQQPFRSHMMSLIEADARMRPIAPSFVLLDSPDYTTKEGMGVEASGSSEDRDSILDQSSAFSDSDVKQVMSKIATLEEERLKLMETIDDLQQQNQTVRTVVVWLVEMG